MQRPRDRTYNFELELDGSPKASKPCSAFEARVRDLLNRGRTVILFELEQSSLECLLVARVSCPSCGQRSLNRFWRSVIQEYPNARMRQLHRDR